MTEEEYFTLLSLGEQRLEYWAGVVDGMAGGSNEHCDIESNLLAEIVKRLDGTTCKVSTTNQAIYVAARNTYVFADLSIVCGPKERITKQGVSCLTNPVTVFEVLSPSSVLKDEYDKFHAYTALRSVREYVIVSTDRYGIKLHERRQADEIWKVTLYEKLGDEFELKSCGIRMKVQDVYGGEVVFPEDV